MDDLQEGKVTAQLVASEASAGAKGGRGDDLFGSNKVALKKKKNREKQARYRANMSQLKNGPVLMRLRLNIPNERERTRTKRYALAQPYRQNEGSKPQIYV